MKNMAIIDGGLVYTGHEQTCSGCGTRYSIHIVTDADYDPNGRAPGPGTIEHLYPGSPPGHFTAQHRCHRCLHMLTITECASTVLVNPIA